tara:strand:+ start:819 stop:1031 length:213 start_codon:yes stop_codon:yes gene_type:complete
MATRQALAYEAKQRFCYIELEKWKNYLCAKRTIEEVEKALAATTSIVVEIQNLNDKIYQENLPEFDDLLN